MGIKLGRSDFESRCHAGGLAGLRGRWQVDRHRLVLDNYPILGVIDRARQYVGSILNFEFCPIVLAGIILILS